MRGILEDSFNDSQVDDGRTTERVGEIFRKFGEFLVFLRDSLTERPTSQRRPATAGVYHWETVTVNCQECLLRRWRCVSFLSSLPSRQLFNQILLVLFLVQSFNKLIYRRFKSFISLLWEVALLFILYLPGEELDRKFNRIQPLLLHEQFMMDCSMPFGLQSTEWQLCHHCHYDALTMPL